MPENVNHKGLRRVVITGMGAVTSLGADVASTWSSVLQGKSGVSKIRQFVSDDFPVHIGSEVDFDSLEAPDFDESLRPYVTRSVPCGGLAR